MGTKPGWKTTEFWVALLLSIGGIAGQLGGLVPGEWGMKLAAISGAAYVLARGFAKHAPPTMPAASPTGAPPSTPDAGAPEMK